MTNFFASEHRTAIVLIAVGAGGMFLLAGGAIFRIERERRRDKELWMKEFNDLRNEIYALRHELDMLRMGLSQFVMRNSGNDIVGPKTFISSIEAKSLSSSTLSLESINNYVDAPDTWVDSTPSTYCAAIRDESQKDEADSKDKKLVEIDGLFERDEYQQAYDYINQLPISSCDDSSFLWRYAKACYSLSKKEDKKSKRKENLIKEGKIFAAKAYEIDSGDFDSLKWFTLLTGAATDYCETRERIEEGQLFKQLLDKALALEPEDYLLLHLRGRYSYAVLNLSWMEKTIVSALFKTSLSATVDEALNDFLKVEHIKPDSWIDNLLFVAKCYLIKKDQMEAVKYLRKASILECSNELEKENLEEVCTLLKKLNR